MELPAVSSFDKYGDLPLARLRIMETTDLHMQLLAYDYFGDRADQNTGLIHLANKIETLRSEKDITSLLFDNGDFIQGNPLADYLASSETTGRIHPMIAAMNTMTYDAVTLGNHEFNYGLPFLQTALQDAKFPVTCANIRQLEGNALAQPYLILERNLRCDDGISRVLKIGVTGFVTPQIIDWDKALLTGMIETDDIVTAAETIVPQIKAAGADIIVALCHSGIGSADHSARMENAAVPLAAVPGIDVVLTGHTHEVFPGDSRIKSDIVDPQAGTLHGKPAVMAGFYGNCLGVVDLRLGWDGGTWQIAGQSISLQRGEPAGDVPSTLEQTLTEHVRDAHNETLDHIRQPIAKTQIPIHSYFATIEPDLTQQLLAKAQQAFIKEVVAPELPVLAATAPFRFGGRAGVGHYIDISPGPLTLRDAATIYPFSNTLCAIRCNGVRLRDWLERAASHFMQITPGVHDQPLLNPHSPAYNSDTIYGLSYELDLTQPERFGLDGGIENPGASRLRNLCYQGKPVADDDLFVIATNSYRTNGGGGFPGTPEEDVLYISTQTTRDVLISYLQDLDTVREQPTYTWRFSTIADTSAIFQSAPAAQRYLTENISHLGPSINGFDSYRFTF